MDQAGAHSGGSQWGTKQTRRPHFGATRGDHTWVRTTTGDQSRAPCRGTTVGDNTGVAHQGTMGSHETPCPTWGTMAWDHGERKGHEMSHRQASTTAGNHSWRPRLEIIGTHRTKLSGPKMAQCDPKMAQFLQPQQVIPCHARHWKRRSRRACYLSPDANLRTHAEDRKSQYCAAPNTEVPC